jgi:hypothetical protein
MIVAILVLIVPLITFKIYFSTGINETTIQIIDKIRNDKKLEYIYRTTVSLVVLVLLSLNSKYCYKVAKNKNKNPWQWAKYGFLFNIWATIYLLFFIEDNDSKSA